MELASVRLPLRVIADSGGWCLTKWLVEPGGSVYRNQRLAVLNSTESGAVDHALAPNAGTLSKCLLAEGAIVESPNSPIAEVQFCPHSVVFRGLCAVCGEEAEPAHFAETPSIAENRLPVAYNSGSLSVTRAEAESISSATARRLFESNRLSLVLDLDHTLVHATDDPRAGAILYHSPEDADKSSVASFTLGPTFDSRTAAFMHVKLRPNVMKFLDRVSKKFELHIYTMGSRPYADQIANLIDPDKRLFSGRITSREDFIEGRFNQKSIWRLFPCDDSMALIVDDREDVWIQATSLTYMPNLVRAEPYSFWDGLHEAYDRASSSELPEKAKTSMPNSSPCEIPPPPVVLLLNGKTASLQNDKQNSAQGQKCSASNGDGLVGDRDTDREGVSDSISKPEEGNQESRSAEPEKLSKSNHDEAEKLPAEGRGPAEVSNGGVMIAEGKGQVPDGKAGSNVSLEGKGEQSNCEGHEEKTEDVPNNKSVGNEKGVMASNSSAGKNAKNNSVDSNEPAPEFSAELRRIVQGWWQSDSLPRSKNHLLRLAEVLEECHTRFFSTSSAMKLKARRKQPSMNAFHAPANVKDILAFMRRDVLRGCVITFTGVIPTGVNPRIIPEWNLARRLGATCEMNFVNGSTTHVITAQHRGTGTQKFREAIDEGTAFIVTTKWLEDTAFNFERQSEFSYRVDVDEHMIDQCINPEEYRARVRKNYADAARKLRKRKIANSDETAGNGPKRLRKEEEMKDGIRAKGAEEGTERPPLEKENSIHILTEEEIGAAMDEAFDDL